MSFEKEDDVNANLSLEKEYLWNKTRHLCGVA